MSLSVPVVAAKISATTSPVNVRSVVSTGNFHTATSLRAGHKSLIFCQPRVPLRTRAVCWLNGSMSIRNRICRIAGVRRCTLRPQAFPNPPVLAFEIQRASHATGAAENDCNTSTCSIRSESWQYPPGRTSMHLCPARLSKNARRILPRSASEIPSRSAHQIAGFPDSSSTPTNTRAATVPSTRKFLCF